MPFNLLYYIMDLEINSSACFVCAYWQQYCGLGSMHQNITARITSSRHVLEQMYELLHTSVDLAGLVLAVVMLKRLIVPAD